MPKKAGRPTKITDDVINQMRSYMMAGVSLKDACELVGIGVTTWREFEQKEPNFRRKRKKWQGMLKARAKVNIAEQVFGNKEKGIEPNLGWSQYVLDRAMDQETKNAQNALTRANARKINAEIERIKAETKRLNSNDEGITKIVFSDDLKPDKEDDSKQKGSEDDGADAKPE